MLLEVRPSEGGDDAVHFASQLFNALLKQVKADVIAGDGRTLRARLDSEKAIADLVGVHRIQRRPTNDRHGRMHTSTATVAIVKEEAVSIALNEAELVEQFTKGSGKGGQNRNKLATAVRLKHIPTGIVVFCCDERHLEQNRQKARAQLREQLQNRAEETSSNATNGDRVRQIKAGDRPAKSFTWNADRDEVLDHQTGRRWRMKRLLKGDFS